MSQPPDLLLNLTAAGLLVVDIENIVRYANPSASELLERPHLVGQPVGFNVTPGWGEVAFTPVGHTPRTLAAHGKSMTWEGQLATLVTLHDVSHTAQQLARSETQWAELESAYDKTLALWAQVMDRRDGEAEGHSQRVADLTVRLAKTLNVPDEMHKHIWRGALLHDIGKVGVPDEILNKPGQLTDEEWDVVRTHPTLAFELLQGVLFLRPALDIPYCHHEKWDGSGYPRRLKGEEIPVAARIFAVVDVWDALRSDRPFRKAWSVEKARDYIMQQVGQHFDPRVVAAFVITIDNL